MESDSTDAPHRGDLPPKPRGWRSATELNREFVGGVTAIRRRLERLRAAVLADLRRAGYADAEAEDLVTQHVIGEKDPGHGPFATLAASPDAVRLLQAEGLVAREDAPPPRPDDWVPVSGLRRRGGGPSTNIALARFERLRDAIINDLRAAGYSDSDAEALVNHHVIGRRSSPGGGGYPTLAASPDALRIAVQAGLAQPPTPVCRPDESTSVRHTDYLPPSR